MSAYRSRSSGLATCVIEIAFLRFGLTDNRIFWYLIYYVIDVLDQKQDVRYTSWLPLTRAQVIYNVYMVYGISACGTTAHQYLDCVQGVRYTSSTHIHCVQGVRILDSGYQYSTNIHRAQGVRYISWRLPVLPQDVRVREGTGAQLCPCLGLSTSFSGKYSLILGHGHTQSPCYSLQSSF